MTACRIDAGVAVVHKSVVMITTGTGSSDTTELTDTLLESVSALAASGASTEDDEESAADSDAESVGSDEEEAAGSRKKNIRCKWERFSAGAPAPVKGSKSKRSQASATSPDPAVFRHGSQVGPRVQLTLASAVTNVAWHYKGDYLSVLAPDAGAQSVSIHQISKGKTQFPFRKAPGKVQAVSFHPSRPYIFVVTQQHVKVFHLVEQKMVKKLVSGCKWLSSIDVHTL